MLTLPVACVPAYTPDFGAAPCAAVGARAAVTAATARREAVVVRMGATPPPAVRRIIRVVTHPRP